MFVRATDSRENLSLTWEDISNRRNLPNTQKFSFCHPPGVRERFIEGEAFRLLRINFSELLKITLDTIQTEITSEGLSR